MSGRGLEALKFGVYLAVPVGLAVTVAVPSVRRRLLSDLGLAYPRDEERPAATRQELQRLQELAERR